MGITSAEISPSRQRRVARVYRKRSAVCRSSAARRAINRMTQVEPKLASAGPRWGWLLDGPDPVEDAEPVGVLEVLLPWPARVFLVLGVIVAAGVFRGVGFGQQVSWGAQAGALSLMGIATGLWWQLLLVDAAFAALWFIPFRERKHTGGYWRLLHVVTFLNRQVGHIWALLVWLVVVLASFPVLPLQIGAAVALLLLGPPLLNWVARLPLPWLEVDGEGKASGDLLWRRRILIYAATFVGWACLGLAEPRQLPRLLPLILAWAVGCVLRVVRHWLRSRRVALERNSAGDSTSLEARAHFRRTQADAARWADPWGALLLPLAIACLVGFSFCQRRKLDDKARGSRAERAYPVEACGRAANAPENREVAVFLLADAQLHELAGASFAGQAEIAQVFVSSASRPVALDILGPLTVRHFVSVYARLNEQRVEARHHPMSWAHLGDMADISCAKELDRMRTELAALPRAGALAGIAPGNHEMSFQGSFHWSPHWDSACASGKLEKDDTTQRLIDDFGAALTSSGGEFVRLPAPLGSARGGSLSAVSLLGIARHQGRERGIVGVFLDTNDGRAFDWGMPGSVGSVSGAQLDAIRAALARIQTVAPAPYRSDAAYVVFSHIPYADLASTSRGRVAEWLVELDGRGGDLRAEPRVLAFISGHTHEASTERFCVGNRLVRQITVGSTTDPPQQAAVVEVGADREGRLALSLRTLQSVERAGDINCERAPRIPPAACQRVAYELARSPACRGALGVDATGAAARDCQELEQSSSFAERFASLETYLGPTNPEARRSLEQLRAEELLGCVCRNDQCQFPREPLNGDAYRKTLDQVWAQPERRDELVCLAWAASATQAHKAAGMLLGDALRCSFDDPTLPAERVYVATLEPILCY